MPLLYAAWGCDGNQTCAREYAKACHPCRLRERSNSVCVSWRGARCTISDDRPKPSWTSWRYYQRISRREDPEIKISIALVITIWPGKGAEEVERLVTRKLEDHVGQLASLEELRSTTRENISLLFVDIHYDADEQMEWQKLRNRLDEARADLPPGVIGPTVVDDFGDVTAMVWTLRSSTAAPRELKAWADKLKDRLKELPAVGKVNLLGEQHEVVYIAGPAESFALYGFSPLVAAKVLDYRNVNLPAGYVRTPERNGRLDATGTFDTVAAISDAVLDVSKQTGHALRVRDVFSVRRAYKEPPYSRVRANGEPAIGLDVRMQRGHNVVAMGDEAKRVAESFRQELPSDITLDLLHDQPHEVEVFIGDFMENLYQGLAIVILVMALAMGLRATAIVALSLPLSIVATLALMPLAGVMLEQVAIAAFIVALGMLVDNAIIVTDNIDVRLRAGDLPDEAAVRGAHELWKPVLTGTLATVAAFLPLLLLKDEMGAYIRALPVVVSLSMLVSYVLALTVTPLMAARVLKAATPGTKADKGPSWVVRAYSALIRAGMRLRWLVLLGALAGLWGAIALVPTVGVSFFPRVDRDQLTVDVWLPEGAGVPRTEQVAREVEAILRQQPEVAGFVTYVGEGGPRFHITVVPQFTTFNYARLMVKTHDRDQTRALVERLRVRFREQIAGAHVMPANILLGKPVEAPIAIKIRGPDLAVMREISEQVQAILRRTPGSDMVRDNLGQDVPSLTVRIDDEAAAMAGLSNTEVAASLLMAHEGLPVTDYRAEADAIPVLMRLSEGERRALKGLTELHVPSQTTGEKVPLPAIATLAPDWRPGVIHHVGGQRTVTVLAETHGRLASQVLADAMPAVDALALPPGYSVRVEGEEKERAKAFGELTAIFALIIGALLFMLVIQFGSLKQALTILASVPLAIIGAVLGLWFSGNSFSFMAFLGVVSLAGMVIKNAVVWVEFVDRALAEGQSLAAAIVDAGVKRFRPILLTAATTIGGLIPLALFGGVLWEGMAWAMIVGLALATVLTLFVSPVIYYLLFRQGRPTSGRPTSVPSSRMA